MQTNVIDKLAWLEVRDRKLLSTRTRGRAVFYIPGGKREAGESDLQALTREVREELSIEIHPASAKLAGVWEAQADHHAAGVLVRMTCYFALYTGQLEPASEIEEIRWLTSADAAISSPVDRLILADLSAQGLID